MDSWMESNGLVDGIEWIGGWSRMDRCMESYG